MIINRICLTLLGLLLCGLAPSRAAEKPKDATTVLTEIRLRQLNKNLELTEEQQKKVRALFALEAEKIAKIDGSGVSLGERTDKINALKKETQESIRPLLTAEQLAKYDAQIKQAEKRKKKA
jgi:hypothetical protein